MMQSGRWVKRRWDRVNFFCMASLFKSNIFSWPRILKSYQLVTAYCSRFILREISRSIGLHNPETTGLRLVCVRWVVGLNFAIRPLA